MIMRCQWIQPTSKPEFRPKYKINRILLIHDIGGIVSSQKEISTEAILNPLANIFHADFCHMYKAIMDYIALH